MRRTPLRALALVAAAFLALPGCVRVVTVPAPVAAAERPAVIDKLALVLPITDMAAPYAAVRWHRARLTIGRHDGSMAEITHTFESTHAGLKAAGGFPALPPGDGYWIRVELVQDGFDGLERVVGRGWVGDEDEAGIALLAGGNLARLNVLPTVAGTQLALSPVTPPRPRAEEWRPSWDHDVREVAVAPAPPTVEYVPLAADDDGPTAPVIDYDDHKRVRHQAPDAYEPLEAPAWTAPVPDDEPSWSAPDDEDAYEEEDAPEPEVDDDADLPSGDVIESFSAYKTR